MADEKALIFATRTDDVSDVASGFGALYVKEVGGIPTLRFKQGAIASDLATTPFVGCKVISGSNISIPNASNTVVNWSSEVFDTDTMFTTGSPGVITCKTAGYYLMVANVTFTSNTTGRRTLIIERVSDGKIYGASSAGAIPNANSDILAVGVGYLNVNDQVRLLVHQNSGGALNIISFDESPSLVIVRQG